MASWYGPSIMRRGVQTKWQSMSKQRAKSLNKQRSKRHAVYCQDTFRLSSMKTFLLNSPSGTESTRHAKHCHGPCRRAAALGPDARDSQIIKHARSVTDEAIICTRGRRLTQMRGRMRVHITHLMKREDYTRDIVENRSMRHASL